MIFSRINLKNALIHERNHQQQLLKEANELLAAASEKDIEITTRLKNSASTLESFPALLSDNENIFTIDEVRKICIRYRLRFLDSSHFKSEYPYAAIAEIKSFEKKYGIKIQSFRIMAPSKAFDLENINRDPLLFAQLNNNSYYLIHQWGHDLAWYRKIITWPLQSFKTLMISIFIVCSIFSFCLPSAAMNILNFQSEMYLRIWLSIHTFIGVLGFSLWGGLSFNKTFSKLNWDSKYYNY